MTDTFQSELAKAIHEVADVAVNYGGYAASEQESAARSAQRDNLETAIAQTVAAFMEGGE